MPGFLLGTAAPAVVLTKEMLAPVTTSITGNVPVLVGAGIALMAVMVGVSAIPRIIYKFF